MTRDNPTPPSVSPQQTAFFLDVDGTVTEIVADPRQARVGPVALGVLESLSRLSDGALALISGRSIVQLDRMLSPLFLPVVGVHGLERRLADRHVIRRHHDAQAHAGLVALVEGFVASYPGLKAEPKPGAVALHFRQRPELAAKCTSFMQAQMDGEQRLSLLHGKMVVELIFGAQTKGDAVAALMKDPPFEGRRAFFAGDDVTDEAGFRRVNALDGITVKIGEGETCARYRLPNPDALVAYLAGMAAQG